MRTNTLPNVLEPTSDGELSYDDPNDVSSYLPVRSFSDSCGSGSESDVIDANGCTVPREICKNLSDLEGYTSFAGPDLLIAKPGVKRACRKPEGCNTETSSTC